MSPYSRPDLRTLTTLNRLSDRPLRFTGHLFFDGSHRPCLPDGTRASPARRLLFEIHPVYAVDVCNQKPAARAGFGPSCDAKKDSDWVELEAWLGEPVSRAAAGGEGE